MVSFSWALAPHHTKGAHHIQSRQIYNFIHCEKHRNVGPFKGWTESHHHPAQILRGICLFQNERESRWDVMKGFVGSPLIPSHPGYNAHAQNPPIFKTARNHTFRTRVKFTTDLCESINTRVGSCRAAIRLFSRMQRRYQTPITCARKDRFLPTHSSLKLKWKLWG